MYGDFGRINAPQKRWPSARGKVLRHIVDTYTANVYHNTGILLTNLSETKLPLCAVKQLELVLTSSVVREFLASAPEDPASGEIGRVLLAIECCGLAEEEARELLSDLLYSIHIEPIYQTYVAVKKAVESRKDIRFLPPQLYQERLREIMGFVSAKEEEKLTGQVQEELSIYAACHIGEANYILSLMYRDGIGVKEDSKLADTYAKKAAAAGYPPAYAMLGDVAYFGNRFDEAYAYYTKPGAIALDTERSSRVDTLLRAKGFANRVCVGLGILYVAIGGTMVWAGHMLSRSGGVLPTFLVLLTLAMVCVLYIHSKKPLQDLRHWGIAFALVFTLYMLFAGI